VITNKQILHSVRYRNINTAKILLMISYKIITIRIYLTRKYIQRLWPCGNLWQIALPCLL